MPVMQISTVSAMPPIPNSTPSSSVPLLVSIFNSFILFAKLLRINDPAKFTNTDNFRTIILIIFAVLGKSSTFALASSCEVRLRLSKKRALTSPSCSRAKPSAFGLH